MKYLGKVNDPKDLATKEYVDEKVSGATGTVTSVNGVNPSNGNIALTATDIPYTAGSSTTVKSEIDDRQMDTEKLDAETEIADGDAFPFYDASESINRKTLWSNIVAKLKILFLPLAGGTVTGPIWVKRATDSYVVAQNTTNDTRCALEAFNNTVGLYAGHLGKWIIKNDGTTTTVDNTIPATAGAVGTTNIANKAVTAAKIGTDVTYSTIGLTSSQVRTIYVGTSAPSSSTGSNGDIYLTYS